MPGVRSTLRELLGTDDLYEALGVKKEASKEQLKRGYHKKSLLFHPDRVHEGGQEAKDEATKKFQVLSAVYKVLSDDEKRAVYDETGEVDDEDVLDENKDWDQYWRLLFKVRRTFVCGLSFQMSGLKVTAVFIGSNNLFFSDRKLP